MTDISSKKANAYLQVDHGDLQGVFTKLRALEELSQAVSPYLDPRIAPFCQVANCAANKLIIIVANGSIATQLRFQSADLIEKFHQHPKLQGIKHIECKVRPTQALAAPACRPQKVTLLSAETAEIVHRMAQSLTDSRLRTIMEKIAGRVKPQSE